MWITLCKPISLHKYVTEEPDENEEEQKPDKQRKTPDSMIYSPSKTTASLMQKISASAPKGVPINQLDKRLALLK